MGIYRRVVATRVLGVSGSGFSDRASGFRVPII